MYDLCTWRTMGCTESSRNGRYGAVVHRNCSDEEPTSCGGESSKTAADPQTPLNNLRINSVPTADSLSDIDKSAYICEEDSGIFQIGSSRTIEISSPDRTRRQSKNLNATTKMSKASAAAAATKSSDIPLNFKQTNIRGDSIRRKLRKVTSSSSSSSHRRSRIRRRNKQQQQQSEIARMLALSGLRSTLVDLAPYASAFVVVPLQLEQDAVSNLLKVS